jgi:hypothetical protein
MLKKIAEVTGISFVETDSIRMSILHRIQRKMPVDISENDPAVISAIESAQRAVDEEGQLAIVSLVRQLTAPPAEKVLKIKSSPKGARIKVAAANGVRFSFGPIWNESVSKCKGIAVVAANRSKLNHQAIMLGVDSPETMEISALCSAISAKLV